MQFLKNYKMLNKILFIFLCLIFNLEAKDEVYKGVVLQTLNSGGYSYIKLNSQNKIFWTAIRENSIKVNDVIEIKAQMWMEDFKSKTLNKTFDKILFASIKKDKIKKDNTVNTMPSLISMIRRENIAKTTFNEESIEVSISELKNKKSLYQNRYIKIIGKVTKVSLNIMKSSWIHLEDKNGQNIIFRSDDSSIKINDKVIASGLLNIDVDYGYGYTYELIVTQASFKKL